MLQTWWMIFTVNTTDVWLRRADDTCDILYTFNRAAFGTIGKCPRLRAGAICKQLTGDTICPEKDQKNPM